MKTAAHPQSGATNAGCSSSLACPAERSGQPTDKSFCANMEEDVAEAEDALSKVDARHQSSFRNYVVKFVRDTQTCSVNGFLFTFLHRLEGKWSGDLQEMRVPGGVDSRGSNGVMSEVSVVSTKITYLPEGCWTFRETTAKRDGAAQVLHFKLTPVAHGVLAVDVTDANSVVSECVMTFNETPSHGAQLSGHHCKSGILTHLQILTLTPSGELERIQLRYTSGELTYTVHSRERRVD